MAALEQVERARPAGVSFAFLCLFTGTPDV